MKIKIGQMKPMAVIKIDARQGKSPATFNEVFGKPLRSTSCIDTVKANQEFDRIQEQIREPLYTFK